MENLNIFLSGVAGAFVIYILMYRDTRIHDFLKNPTENWMMLFIDFFLFLMAGGLVAAFALSKPTTKEAFIAGISWQGVVGGIFSSIEYSKLEKDYSELNTKLTESLKDLEILRLKAARSYYEEDDDIQFVPEN